MDTAININDQRTADAFWTLLKPLIQFIRIAYQMLKNL